jgi:hypothetical protein
MKMMPRRRFVDSSTTTSQCWLGGVGPAITASQESRRPDEPALRTTTRGERLGPSERQSDSRAAPASTRNPDSCKWCLKG